MTKEIQLFYKDYFFCLTTEEKIIGGKRCNDSNLNSTLCEINIVRSLALDKGISVNGFRYADIFVLEQELVEKEGNGSYYVYGEFVLVENPDQASVCIYGCSDIDRCMEDAMKEAGFIPQDNWDSHQRQMNFIKFLHRIHSCEDDKLETKKTYDAPPVGITTVLFSNKASEGSKRITPNIVGDYRSTMIQGNRTLLIGYIKNDKEGEAELSKAINGILNPDSRYGRSVEPQPYIIIDLRKVKDAKQFWTDLFVLNDYKAYTYIFTGVGQIKDPELQGILIYMMKREQYCPKNLTDKPIVDFSELNPILINEVDSYEDTLPAYARSKYLKTYIENI